MDVKSKCIIMYKPGDKVHIKDFGASYTTHSTMMEIMGFKDPYTSREGYIRKLMNNKGFKAYYKPLPNVAKRIFTVFAVKAYEFSDSKQYVGIRDSKGNELLIESGGIKKTKKQIEEDKLEFASNATLK